MLHKTPYYCHQQNDGREIQLYDNYGPGRLLVNTNLPVDPQQLKPPLVTFAILSGSSRYHAIHVFHDNKQDGG